MTTAEPAARAVSNSPLRVTISENNLQNDGAMIHRWTSPDASTFKTEIETNSAKEKTAEFSQTDPNTPSFLVHIFPTRNWPHKRMIQASPLHGPWPRREASRAASYVSADLATRIPSGIAAEGLKTWDLESYEYSHQNLFYRRRISRRDFTYPGAVPELMSNKRRDRKAAGLLARGEFSKDKISKELVDVDPPSPLFTSSIDGTVFVEKREKSFSEWLHHLQNQEAPSGDDSLRLRAGRDDDSEDR